MIPSYFELTELMDTFRDKDCLAVMLYLAKQKEPATYKQLSELEIGRKLPIVLTQLIKFECVAIVAELNMFSLTDYGLFMVNELCRIAGVINDGKT